MLFRRFAALFLLSSALVSGCGDQDFGSFPGVEVDPDLTLDELHQVPSAVDLRVTEEGLSTLLDTVLPSILGEGQTNPDGTITLDLGLLPEELLTAPLNFGPFQSGTTLREVTISIDLTKLQISFLPSDGPIRIRVQATDLPIRIDHAIIAGQVSIFGIQSNSACRLKTEAPEMTTLIDVDAVVTLTSLPEQGFDSDIDITLLDIKDINLTVEKDCSFPECSDQVAFENPCLECNICDSSLLTPDLLNGLRDLLGNAFQELLTFLVQTLIDIQLGDQFNQVLQDIGLRIQMGQLIGSFAPALEPIAAFWREIELKSKPSISGFSSIDGDLMAGLDLGLRAPHDGCGVNRPYPATLDVPPSLGWPETTSSGQDYDLGLRLRPELIERLTLALFKVGLGCTTIRPQDIQALTSLNLVLNQDTMHLLFPEFMGVGDPELPLRFQVHLAEDEIRPLHFSVVSHDEGGMGLDFSMNGLEIIVTADGHRGPSWLALKPSIEGSVRLFLDQQSTDLQIQVESINLEGLGDSTTPLTATSDTQTLLEGIEGFANELSFGDPISIPLAGLLETVLPGTALVGIGATNDGRMEMYLRFEEQNEVVEADGAAGILLSSPSSTKPQLPVLIWLMLALVLWILKSLPSVIRGAGLSLCFGGLIFAPACEPTHLDSFCSADTDCGTGYLCNQEGHCVLGVPCTSNGDCCLGFICVHGLCARGPDCVATGCPLPGTVCTEGICLAQSCTSADQCPTTAPCEEGFCTSLVCPDGQALDRPAARCMNLPESCANLACTPGTLPEILGGPHTGEQCPSSDTECGCMNARPLDEPRPSGDISVSTTGEIFWHDAKYGDLIASNPNETYGAFEDFILQAESTIIDGLPIDGIASGALTGWRTGIGEPGPDVGRSISSMPWPDGPTIVAAIGEPNRALVVHAFDTQTRTTEKVFEYPGRVLAGPVLHLSPEDRACVSFVHSTDDYTRKLRVFCSHRPEQSGSFAESFAVTLSPEPLDPNACGDEGCASGSRCVRTPANTIDCALQSDDCSTNCDQGWACVSPHGCAPLVYPQDLIPSQSTDFLSVSQGQGPNTFITTSVSPNEVVAIRWFGAKNYEMVPIWNLPAGGGRGALSAASVYGNQNTRILLSLDSWPNLYRFDWPNGQEQPSKMDPENLNLPGGTKNRAREIRAGPTHQGAPTWIMRVQPDDRLLWIKITSQGIEILELLSPEAVVGISDPLGSWLWGWKIHPVTGSFFLHQWFLGPGPQ